eukprot:6205083-Pleurochrysis_carterae.AAC.1
MSGGYPMPHDAVEDYACCDAALVGVGRLSVGHNLADESLHLECFLLLLGPLVAYVGAQPALALPASDSRAAPNAAAVDAGIAVLEVVRVLVSLEELRLQLQHVR